MGLGLVVGRVEIFGKEGSEFAGGKRRRRIGEEKGLGGRRIGEGKEKGDGGRV